MVNGQCLKDSWYLDVSLVAEGSGDLEHGRKIKDPPSTMAPTLLSHAYTSWYVGYIYICTNLNGGTPFFGPPLPPNARLKQPGWPCPSVRPCNGFKPLKWATEVAGPRVPRGQRLPTWKYVIMCLWETILVVGYWNDTPRIIFSFGYVFFLGGGGLNEWWWHKIWNTNFVGSRQIRRPIPFRMASFTTES